MGNKKMNIKYRRDLWRLLIKNEAGNPLLGDAAEIGVAEGNFSRDILNWPVKFDRLYLVDRWQCTPQQKGDASMPQAWHDKNLAQVHEKMAGNEHRVVFLRGSSVDMALKVPNRTLALVYIDADHSYEGVKKDINAWLPKLVIGGYIAFHDYEAPQYGVKRAVQEFCKNRSLTVHPIPEDKPEDAGAYFQWEG